MHTEYTSLVQPLACQDLLTDERQVLGSRTQIFQLAEVKDRVGLIQLLHFYLRESPIGLQVGLYILGQLFGRFLLQILVPEGDKEVRIVVVVVGLLLLDLIADIACGGDVRFLHGDVHVISGDRLEHGLALIP